MMSCPGVQSYTSVRSGNRDDQSGPSAALRRRLHHHTSVCRPPDRVPGRVRGLMRMTNGTPRSPAWQRARSLSTYCVVAHMSRQAVAPQAQRAPRAVWVAPCHAWEERASYIVVELPQHRVTTRRALRAAGTCRMLVQWRPCPARDPLATADPACVAVPHQATVAASSLHA